MKKLLVYALVVLAVSLSANAAVMSYTVSFSDSYDGVFNINKVLSVPRFNPLMGTLQSVTIDYGISANGTVGFESTSTNPLVDGEFATYFYWQNPVTNSTKGNLKLDFDSTTVASVNWDVRETYILNLAAFDGNIDYAGASGFMTTYLDKSDSGSLFYNSNLGSFVGDSMINVTFDLVGQAYSAIATPGNGSSQVRTFGAGDVTITYQYIPEPATMCLLGLGGLLLRKKK